MNRTKGFIVGVLRKKPLGIKTGRETSTKHFSVFTVICEGLHDCHHQAAPGSGHHAWFWVPVCRMWTFTSLSSDSCTSVNERVLQWLYRRSLTLDEDHGGGPVDPDLRQTLSETLLLQRRDPHRDLPHRVAHVLHLRGKFSSGWMRTAGLLSASGFIHALLQLLLGSLTDILALQSLASGSHCLIGLSFLWVCTYTLYFLIQRCSSWQKFTSFLTSEHLMFS